MKRLIFLSVVLTLILVACNNSQNRIKTPDELRQELLVREQSTPSQYLKDNGTWRKNLIGATVLEGTISNSATLANFKDIVLKVGWLSKTNTVIKTEEYIIYENVGAGQSIPYKIKVDAPPATNGVQVGV